MTQSDAYPSVTALADIVAGQWPEHAAYIGKRLEGRTAADLAVSDDFAESFF